ncbi:MAG: helix-turn-helix domain-containing protein [Ruminococcus sp.]|nr:helix-turn-helix domain-containing protein [Ruminococcus sp.]
MVDFDTERKIAEHLFSKREDNFEHASFDREVAFYESICSGNMELVKVFMKPLFCEGCGILSEDFLRNLKYHMVVLAAMIARYCINGGMTPEESYSLSDFYIMKTDKCRTESEIRAVHVEMIEGYTNKMRQMKLSGVYSKQIVRAIDYIICHLHNRIFLEETAEHLKISSSYLSRLFKKETGIAFGEYVNKLKIEEAASLLLYTEYTDTEISNLLGFSSQSYFIKIFKKHTGTTPKTYKKQYNISIMQTAG